MALTNKYVYISGTTFLRRINKIRYIFFLNDCVKMIAKKLVITAAIKSDLFRKEAWLIASTKRFLGREESRVRIVADVRIAS